jgi:starch phosphorylase
VARTDLSVVDGWWAEAYDGLNGFAIGMGETHTSSDVHDRRDAEALLSVLRDQVVPMYFERGESCAMSPRGSV